MIHLLLVSSCNGVGTASFSENATVHENQPPSHFNFAGITSIDNITDSTLRVNWMPHPEAVAYDIFDATSGVAVWRSTVNGQASASATLTGLTPGQLYKFIVRAKDSSWVIDDNANQAVVTMNGAPEIPAALTLVAPASPAYFPTPTLQVTGLKSGDTVKVYRDSACLTEVASGISNSATLNLTTIPLATGTYTFYAKAINASNNASACSTASASFQVLAPAMPSGITLVTPASATSFLATPVIHVAGVTSGHTVKLFSDSSCATEVASGVATSSTIDLTTSALLPGSYNFYARAINVTISACSTATLSYTVYSSFSGISSITQKTDSTLQLNWTAHASASAYVIYETTSLPIVISTVPAPASSAVLTGLTPGASYRFMVKARDAVGAEDMNTIKINTTMNIAPTVPASLTLISPGASPGIEARPVVQVGGLKSGDTIKLFSDSSCTTEVASGVATGSTINLKTSALLSGVYNFYANSRNSVNISACSTATVAYTKIDCPTGFIPVIANSTLGTTDFCVMKFEAKNVGTIATSQAASPPWVTINQANAAAKCAALGSKYDLISNTEWMAIAYNVESVGVNWSGGSVGQGQLFRGHTDNNPANTLDVTNINNPYIGTGDVATLPAGKEQKRTFTLTNGEEIWDFSGNLWEWVDWTLAPGLTSGPITCTGTNQLNAVNCAALAAIDYMPGNPTSVPMNTYDSLYGIGQLIGGTGGGTMRGGNYTYGASGSGIYAVSFNVAPTTSGSGGIGFRCVYRP
jgi:DNA-directed RNA polymerase subunit H (RpoH/RPB5)